jgi:hypothetical protein
MVADDGGASKIAGVAKEGGGVGGKDFEVRVGRRADFRVRKRPTQEHSQE